MTTFKNLKEGDKLSETQYYSVAKVKDGKVQLINDFNESIVVDSGYVEKCLDSADQFSDTKRLSKTEVTSIFLASTNTVMTVNFNKQVKEEDLVTEVMEAYKDSTIRTMEDAVKKAIKKGIKGEERTMVGRHYGSQDEFGRIHFIDMEVEKDASKDYDTRQRLVDPRTINWLIVNGTKYIVK